MAIGCQKNNYDGGDVGDFKADCLQNEGYGDWFSWEMVNRYHEKLCPNGWRLPNTSDFVALDIALGGWGIQSDDEVLRDKYLDVWGGAYNGDCEYVYDDFAEINYQEVVAFYWSLSTSELASENARGLRLLLTSEECGSHFVMPQYSARKNRGFAVRCVK